MPSKTHSSQTMAVTQAITQLSLLFFLFVHNIGFAVLDPGMVVRFGSLDLGNSEEPLGVDPWPQYFADGYMGKRMNEMKHEKRSLSGTQDWGKRSSASRPLRMGKRKYYFNNWSPINSQDLNIMKTLSKFG